MSKRPALRPKQVIKALERHGLYIHHVRGSYYFLRKGDCNVVTPWHHRDLKPGTLMSSSIKRLKIEELR